MRCRRRGAGHLVHGVDDEVVHACFGLTLKLAGTEDFGVSVAGDPVKLALVGALGEEPPQDDHQRPDRQDGDEREDHGRFTCRPVSVTTWPSCVTVSVFR